MLLCVAQARGKNTACESDTVLFDKTKRQSMMTESMRHKPNAQAYQASSEAVRYPPFLTPLPLLPSLVRAVPRA